MEDAEHARLEQLREALLRIRGTAASSDQSVTVEVGADGALHDVQLSETGLGLDPKLLVDHIIALHRLAYAEASDAMRATVEDLQNQTRMGNNSERTDDLGGSESEPDAPRSRSATLLEPAPPSEEKPQEESSPQAHEPQPNPAPDPANPRPDPRERTHDTPQVADAPSGVPEGRLAHVIRPYEPSYDGDGMYDLIEPGDDNPYAAVIATPPSPRRVPLPSSAAPTSDVDANDRPAPQPTGPPWQDATMLPDPALPPNHDYPVYDYLGYDDLGYDYHWDN